MFAIAGDAQPGDIVISSDSDMMAYASVQTLWWPVSQGLILVYSMPDVLKTIEFSRNQLTALAIVSRNEYQRNIYSLSPASNYSIIKAIGHRPVVRDIVSAYLRDGKVVTRSTQQETFKASMRAFIDQLQTRMEPVVFQMPSQVVFDACQQRSEDLMQRYNLRKQTRGTISRRTSFECGSLSLSIGTELWNHPFRSQGRPRHKQPLSHRNTTHPPLQHNKTTVIQLSTGPEYPGTEPDSRSKKEPGKRQFVLKYCEERPTTTTNQPSDNKPKAKAEKNSTFTKKPPGTKGKKGLVRSMAWYHPTVTLETGTLAANTKRVFTPSSAPASSKPTTATPAPSTPVLDRPDLQRLVVECLQEAPRLSAGQFVETMNKEMDAAELRVINKLLSTTESMTEVYLVRKLAEARRDAISDDERRILDHLCERIKLEEDNGENEGDCETKNGEDNGDIDDKDGAETSPFSPTLSRVLYSGNYPEMKNKTVESLIKDIGVIPTVNTFSNWLVDRKLYNPPRSRGEIDVQMPFTPNILAEVMKKKGTLGTTVDIQIREEISAAENFLHLNTLTNNSRKIASFTISQQPFVSFSERELAVFFWKRKPLRERLEELACQDHTQITSTNDLDTWISVKEPGTDGFRVQFLAFTLRELQDVRYRRFPESRLPPRLTSTVGGTDYYLQEIRNLITSKEDIERLWLGINIEDIRTLTLGAGQACVIGGFAHLPTELSTESKVKGPVKNDLGGVMVANQQPAVGAVA
ncbi:hypothetical protein BGX30_013727 [Mortierella sp. GBA39]|nr:hypothetical protein BGX30_013727 [Mortierella sp. GBA39]